jgi:hypothetical protein
MEQAASQLVASGKHLDAIVSDLALSSDFMNKLLDSGQPVPVIVGAAYTPQQVQLCPSSPKFRCIIGSGAGLTYRIAIVERSAIRGVCCRSRSTVIN